MKQTLILLIHCNYLAGSEPNALENVYEVVEGELQVVNIVLQVLDAV